MKGNTEEENNGYVVFKLNSHNLLQQASGQIFKDYMNGFSSTSDICFMKTPFEKKYRHGYH